MGERKGSSRRAWKPVAAEMPRMEILEQTRPYKILIGNLLDNEKY